MAEQYKNPLDEEILPILFVGAQATQGLVGYTESNERTYFEEAWLDKLKEDAGNLYNKMLVSAVTWGCEDADSAEHFANGFALTFAAICYQAELIGGDLPSHVNSEDDNSIAMLSYHIECAGDGGKEYFMQSHKELSKFNPELMATIGDYIKDNGLYVPYPEGNGILADQNGHDFMLGAVIAHDLIREELNASAIVDTYIASSTEGPADHISFN